MFAALINIAPRDPALNHHNDDYPPETAGFGAFGKVYKGRRKGTAEIVALKFIAKRGRSRKDLDLLYAE